MTPWTIACQDPLSVGFPRQEYCSRLPYLSPGHLPNQGIELTSPALVGGFFTTEPPGKPCVILIALINVQRLKNTSEVYQSSKFQNCVPD